MNDDELLMRLRESDPAAGLTPLADPERRTLLHGATTAPRSRSAVPRLRLAIGSVVVAAAVVAGTVVLLPQAAPPGPSLALDAPGADPAAQCAPLADFAVRALREADVAFSGTVTGASAGAVEIRPDRFFRGGPASAVRLRTDAGGGPALDGADLRQGERVLVAATDGQVAPCGLSAADSPELRRYYAAAFG